MSNIPEVIDVDLYAAKKAAGKMKQKIEVIDLDTYTLRDMTRVDMRFNSSPETIDVDSFVNTTAVKTLANNQGVASLRNNYEEVMRAPKKSKSVTATKKAPVLPDEWVPEHIKQTHHVIEMGDAVYDAMLTQTNIENDTNDFYVIQVLKNNGQYLFTVYHRWGRVGENGEIKLSGPHSCSVATEEFEEIFYKKTKNHWFDRQKFISYPKCYTWLEMNYRRKEHGTLSLPSVGQTTFGPRVAKFMSLICNFSMMTQQMTDIGYDAEKLPLQNLSKSTILKAYDVLTLIAEVIGEENRKLLEELSGEFYTIIPHVFGEKSMRYFIINTHQKLRSKMEMVESLGEIEHATKLLGNFAGPEADVMFAQYQLLRCALSPVAPTTKEYEMIQTYMKNTAAGSKPEIVQIFRVSKEGENARFSKYAGMKNRMLLWHGSRLTNWLGILSQGLRIAPKEAPSSGASYGKGIYFADMFAKSQAYAAPSYSTQTSSATAILLLCEVALGEIHMASARVSRNGQLPPGKLSLKGGGNTGPSDHQVLEDGVIIPIGNTITQQGGGYSEYVVYKEDQVKMRYIVQVEFKYN